MRLIDADDLQTRFAYKFHLLTSSTVLLDEDDVCETIDNTPTVMQIEWNKPSEELPKNHRPILFTTKELDSGILIHGCLDDDNRFRAYFTHETWTEEQVTAWCYAPSLPEWCEEE